MNRNKEGSSEEAAGVYSSYARMMALYEKYAKLQGCSLNTILVMYAIWSASSECSQISIAEELSLPKQTVGSVLASLKWKGFVKDSVSVEDRRRRLIELTSEGMCFCREKIEPLIAIEERAITRIDKDDLRTMSLVMNTFSEAFEESLSVLGHS